MSINGYLVLNVSNIEKCIGLFCFSLNLANSVLNGGRTTVINAVWLHVDEGTDEASIKSVFGHPNARL